MDDATLVERLTAERDALLALVGKLNKYDIRLPNHLSHSDEDEDKLSEVLMELAALERQALEGTNQ